MSTKKKVLIGVLGLLLLLEAGDFFGNLSTAASSEAFEDAKESLDIGSTHQALRLAFLIPVSGVIAVLSGLVLVGQLKSSSLARLRGPLLGALVALALFHLIFTGAVLQSAFGVFGVLYLVFAGLISWLSTD